MYMLWSCDQVIINAYMVIKAIISFCFFFFPFFKHKAHEICNEQVDVMKTTIYGHHFYISKYHRVGSTQLNGAVGLLIEG